MAQHRHYGSDKTGLIWGYRFTAGAAGQSIVPDTLLQQLHEVQNREDEFIWLHFTLANSATLKWLKRNLKLPESFYESLQDHAGSTRIEQESDSLVVTINDVLFDFDFDSTAIASGRLYIDRHLVISVRLRPLSSMEKLRSDVRDGQPFASSIILLSHLLQDQVGVLETILRKKSIRVDQIEDQLLANRIAVKRSELSAIRRILVRLQRLLAPEPAAFFRLLNRPPVWINGDDLAELRQSAEEFSLAVGDAGNLIERTKLLQEELGALVIEQSNRTLSVLTLVTVLALPINLTAGLFGMNVGGIPLSESAHGFILVAGNIVVLTLLLAAAALRRTREP